VSARPESLPSNRSALSSDRNCRRISIFSPEIRRLRAPQGATFRTWLFTLAHNRAIDRLRQSGREVSLDSTADGEREPWQPAADAQAWQAWPAAAAASTAEDQAFWRAAGQRLLDCLETLPAMQRSAFLLHHEDGLALDELARTLEVGFETAKSRLRYAMAKLRACMGAYLPARQDI